MKNIKGQSVCFFSSKGGVGKTTNLLNLAGIFEQLEKKVLILDFDLYNGGIATYLNRGKDCNLYHVVTDILNGNYVSIDKYVTKVDNYIDVIGSLTDPRDASKIDSKYVSFIINEAKLKYDVVLIDTNHSLDAVNLSILDSVDKILFFITNDCIDLKNIRSLLSILDNLGIDKYRILLNNSRDPFKDYFSFFEIRKIINHHINYTLSSDMFIRDITKMEMKGAIMTLDKSFSKEMPKDYKTFVTIATNILGDKDE